MHISKLTCSNAEFQKFSRGDTLDPRFKGRGGGRKGKGNGKGEGKVRDMERGGRKKGISHPLFSAIMCTSVDKILHALTLLGLQFD